MKPSFRLNVLGVVIVSVLLVWLAGEAVAQGPGPQLPVKPTPIHTDNVIPPEELLAPQAQQATAFTYQGQLKKGTTPVTANCSMDFRLYDQLSGGNQVGGPIVFPTVAVNNSLFTVQLDFGAAFTGDARWLGILVRCPPDSGYTDLGRQPITAAPYALSLRPGTVISGSVFGGPVLQIYNTDPSPGGGGYAISAINYSGNTWRPAIYGENKGASAGVFGSSSGWHGVVGWGQSSTSAGVYGYNGSTGYGGWFDSSTDHGDLVLGGAVGRLNTDPNNQNSNLILSSNNDVTVRLDNDGGENAAFRVVSSGGASLLAADELYDNVSQLRTGSGLVKAAVYADCNKHGSSIIRSFNNVGGTITIANTVDDGTCIIDFGFQVNDRFFTAMATDYDYEVGHTPPNVRGATCGFTANSNQLMCYRWNGYLGDLVNGGIMVVIY